MIEVKTAFCGIVESLTKRHDLNNTFLGLCSGLLLIGSQGGCQLRRSVVEKRESGLR